MLLLIYRFRLWASEWINFNGLCRCMWWRLRSFLFSIQLENMDAVNLDRGYVAKIVFHSVQFSFEWRAIQYFPFLNNKHNYSPIFHMQSRWKFVYVKVDAFNHHLTKWIDSKIQTRTSSITAMFSNFDAVN